MAALGRAVATLRVMGPDLLPDEVTGLIRALPTRAYARGHDIPSKHGATRVATIGFWSCDAAETEPADIDAQVAELLGRLTPDLDAWAQLRHRFSVELFCGWFLDHPNEGVELAAETLIALGERGIALGVDIYAYDD